MKIVIAGFEGRTNSAKLLLDQLPSFHKIYLQNNREKSVAQLLPALRGADYFFAFGQKPLIRDKIHMEQCASDHDIHFETNYPIPDILSFFQDRYPVICSRHPGTSFCNHIYFSALSYIQEHQLDTKILFLHIPMLRNLSDLNQLRNAFELYVSQSALFVDPTGKG